MDFQTLESVVDRAKKRPGSTSTLLVIGIGVFVLGSFAHSYFAERGRRLADPDERAAGLAASGRAPEVSTISSTTKSQGEPVRASARALGLTFEEYVARWSQTATSLQRDELEQQVVGKFVIWDGLVRTVEADSDGHIDVVVGPLDGSFGSAFLEFPSMQRTTFLRIRPNQHIRFTGEIRTVIASGAFLEQCELLAVQ